MWPIGCFIAELFLGSPLFPAISDLAQLPMIFEKLGVPNEGNWPGVTKMPAFAETMTEYNKIERKPENQQSLSSHLKIECQKIVDGKIEKQLKNKFAKHLDDKAIDLISLMLDYNPSTRMSAEQALKHPYFTEDPFPSEPNEIPKIEGEFKELDYRQ